MANKAHKLGTLKPPVMPIGDVDQNGLTLKLPDGLVFERLDEMKDKGTSYPINLSSSRDESFDDDDSENFLVLEKEDLLAIKKLIERTLMEET